MTKPIKPDATIGEKYGPAMHITDQAEADQYLTRCVEHCMAVFGLADWDAMQVERANLAYYAGYHSNETRARVERLFRCKHPYFGAIAEKGPPTPTAIIFAVEAMLKDMKGTVQ